MDQKTQDWFWFEMFRFLYDISEVLEPKGELQFLEARTYGGYTYMVG